MTLTFVCRRLGTQLKGYGIDIHFENIYGLSDNFAVSKIDRGHELIAKLGRSKSDLIMVGDTDHDHEVATALGIDVLLLGDAHQAYQRLQPIRAEFLLRG